MSLTDKVPESTRLGGTLIASGLGLILNRKRTSIKRLKYNLFIK
ncbi:PEP-CTERM sorting domain-containing protein [Nostoc sp. C110]